jgi:hypothetical protein
MIRKVKFSNFYSFYKEQEISFLAKKKKTHDYYLSDSGDQISKIAGFVGSNASGKTNVMRLFSFLGFFVCRKADDDPALISKIVFKTFFNNEEKSNFYVEFEINSSIFYYNFSILKDKIVEEKLEVREIKKGARLKTVFQRRANDLKFLDEDFFKNISIKSLPQIRGDVSFISFIKLSQYKVDIIDIVYDYFLGLRSNINEVGQNLIHQFSFQGNVLNSYFKDKDIREKAEEIVRNFDLGLSGFEIKKLEKKDKSPLLAIKGVHSTKMKNNKLDFQYESSGTRSLFFALANILNALRYNNVVVVDEIESGLHPEALSKIINYFINENEKGQAQLIFSSHSLDFMRRLDMHQIFLLEKNNNGESEIVSLNKIKGVVRSDGNFLAKYMSGAYGAFPKIRI